MVITFYSIIEILEGNISIQYTKRDKCVIFINVYCMFEFRLTPIAGYTFGFTFGKMKFSSRKYFM